MPKAKRNTDAAIGGKRPCSVTQDKRARRPDVVLFVNGLPLAVVEIKNPTDESSIIWSASQQFQTCKAEMASLLASNALLAIPDGVEALVSTLTAGRECFEPWRPIAGDGLVSLHMPQLHVAIEGRCARRRLLDLVRDFIVYVDDGGGRVAERIAGYGVAA